MNVIVTINYRLQTWRQASDHAYAGLSWLRLTSENVCKGLYVLKMCLLWLHVCTTNVWAYAPQCVSVMSEGNIAESSLPFHTCVGAGGWTQVVRALSSSGNCLSLRRRPSGPWASTYQVKQCGKTRLQCGWGHFLSRVFWTVLNGEGKLSPPLTFSGLQMWYTMGSCLGS